MKMFNFIHQAEIIRKLDSYVKLHQSSLDIKATGICNGLSTVHARYCLEGRKDEFFNLLKYISETPVVSFSAEVSQLVVEIFVTHIPQIFNQKLSQYTAYKALSINGEPLICALQVAMITNSANWETIFKNIDLRDNEAIVVIGHQHAVCISKEENGYLLYDPNNLSKPSHIKTEVELIRTLRKCASFDTHGPLGLTLSVLQHPQHKRSLSYNARSLYEQFLTKDNINMKTKSDHEHKFSSLDMMLRTSDVTLDDIKRAISLGAKSTIEEHLFLGLMINFNVSEDIIFYYISKEIAALTKYLEDIQSTFNKNQKEVPVIQEAAEDISKELENRYLPEETLALLRKIKSVEKETAALQKKTDNIKYNILELKIQKLRLPLQNFVSQIISTGLESLFDKVNRVNYLDLIYGKEWPYEKLLFDAAKSGYSSMFSKILSLYIDSNSVCSVKDIMDKNDLIVAAIEGGSADCLTHILNMLQQKNYDDWNEKKLLNYLSKAVDSKNHQLVGKILEIIPDEQLKSVHVPLKVMQRTPLPVLLLLQKKDVPFSKNAEYILSQKARHPSNILSWLLVLLEKIKDFLSSRQEILYKTDEQQVSSAPMLHKR